MRSHLRTNRPQRSLVATAITLALGLTIFLWSAALAQDPVVVGESGAPAYQNIPSVVQIASTGDVSLVPAGPTSVAYCIPFGTNTTYGFTGFVYRNVPAFNLNIGDTIEFDLGALNDRDTRRNIYFAQANVNPGPYTGTSQGVQASGGWTQVVSDSQTPLNPRGNSISGDYELRYMAQAPFSFLGGGLLVGFGGSPPGSYADYGCQQVLVATHASDPSGYFYTRFFRKPDQDTTILDADPSGGIDAALGGMVIHFINYNWSGFFAPVANPPAFNAMTAGIAVSARFSLGDDQGLNIFAPGYPLSRQIDCQTGAPVDAVEETVPPGGAQLSHKAETGIYQYAWKTSPAWAGTCRELVLRLTNGSEHTARFKF